VPRVHAAFKGILLPELPACIQQPICNVIALQAKLFRTCYVHMLLLSSRSAGASLHVAFQGCSSPSSLSS
jgi:hypothetical protein